MASVSNTSIREVMLEVVHELSSRGSGYFQQGEILDQVATRLGVRKDQDRETECAILSFWNDLFRYGYLGWGSNLTNPDAPFVHLREQGINALENLSRDPSNPDGYIKFVDRTVPRLNTIAKSYLIEAVHTYNSVCFKSTAVMIGCSTESIILELRDTIVEKMNTVGIQIPSRLNDWRIKTVSDAIVHELDSRTSVMPRSLSEAYRAYWTNFISQIRIARNDSGHPSSLDPLTEYRSQASLLLFPEMARIAYDLIDWIPANFV